MKNDDQRINLTSHNVEWYTPSYIVEAARTTMGGIELDPASSYPAQKIVKADRFIVAPEAIVVDRWGGVPVLRFDTLGGLSQVWEARSLWLNHPFGRYSEACREGCKRATCFKRGWHSLSARPGSAAWISTLVNSVVTGRVQSAMTITYASTSEDWFQPLADYWQCFLSPRTSYVNEAGAEIKGAPRGSVVTYLSNSSAGVFSVDGFWAAFGGFGKIRPPAL